MAVWDGSWSGNLGLKRDGGAATDRKTQGNGMSIWSDTGTVEEEAGASTAIASSVCSNA